jgi:hypothetical protein
MDGMAGEVRYYRIAAEPVIRAGFFLLVEKTFCYNQDTSRIKEALRTGKSLVI